MLLYTMCCPWEALEDWGWTELGHCRVSLKASLRIYSPVLQPEEWVVWLCTFWSQYPCSPPGEWVSSDSYTGFGLELCSRKVSGEPFMKCHSVTRKAYSFFERQCKATLLKSGRELLGFCFSLSCKLATSLQKSDLSFRKLCHWIMLISGDGELTLVSWNAVDGSKMMLPKLCCFCCWADAVLSCLSRWRMKLITAFGKSTMDTMGQTLMQPVVLLTMYRGRWDTISRCFLSLKHRCSCSAACVDGLPPFW